MRGCSAVVVFASLLLCAMWGYVAFYPQSTRTAQVRSRITVTVHTPAGDRRGSGVWGYSESAVSVFNAGYHWEFRPRLEGDAIPIDLDNGRTIFVLLGSSSAPGMRNSRPIPASFSSTFSPLDALRQGDRWPTGWTREDADGRIARARSRRGRAFAMDCSPGPARYGECPAMVVADGPSARNLQLLDPDNFAATLGQGYWLGDVAIEVVDDPVDHAITRRLPWVRPATAKDFAASTSSDDIHIRMTGFSRKDPATLAF